MFFRYFSGNRGGCKKTESFGERKFPIPTRGGKLRSSVYGNESAAGKRAWPTANGVRTPNTRTFPNRARTVSQFQRLSNQIKSVCTQSANKAIFGLRSFLLRYSFRVRISCLLLNLSQRRYVRKNNAWDDHWSSSLCKNKMLSEFRTMGKLSGSFPMVYVLKGKAKRRNWPSLV